MKATCISRKIYPTLLTKNIFEHFQVGCKKYIELLQTNTAQKFTARFGGYIAFLQEGYCF